ncbi:MAG: ATP-binding protein [Candidatus Aenigmarchaeota archaeon]|nr:ATP-binding protein [Candidatus Aenigmarchaeota archaeon]
MKKIVLLSGKGGVGKSSITASLALMLSKKNKIVIADCDVDAPNLALVLGVKQFDEIKGIEAAEKAVLIEEKCIGCKKCLNNCVFSAISWDKEKNKPIFDHMRCEGCGTCEIVCPENAIKLKRIENAKVGIAEKPFPIFSGQLNIGESGSGKVVFNIKQMAEEKAKEIDADYLLIDSAAGIGCPVIASVTGSDYAIIITEPSPSAFNDFKRAMQIVKHFNIPFGTIINKWDLNKEFTEKMEKYFQENNIKILEKIPYDRKFVDALVNLTPIVVYNKSYEQLFEKIIDKISVS